MRLLKFKLAGIKRFEDEASLIVGDQLVALVGPNEAGKSTVLDALWWVDHTEPLPESIRTRRINPVPRIRALFELEAEDHDALKGIYAASEIRLCWLEKTSLRSRSWTLEPEPPRDLAPRRETLNLLRACADDPHLDPSFSNAEDLAWDPESFDAALQALASDDDTLTADVLESLTLTANQLRAIVPPEPETNEDGETDEAEVIALAEAAAARHEAAASLDDTVHHESGKHPRDQVIAVLERRIPRFAKFDDPDRNLLDEYDLNEIVQDPPAPLSNLANLANLDLTKLHAAATEPDKGHVQLLCDQANARLAEVFEDSWDQSIATPHIRVDDTIISILIEAGPQIGWIAVGDRSDGLRWFLALRAFLHRTDVTSTILLIDEIETHLHLGAQANLIEVLTNQRLAKQVIYSTHSPGALPPDLGTGVRAVVPGAEHRSSIDNAFWTSGPGHAPLLFGMGASSLAFSIPRKLLIGEGASDAILLPTMIREATGGHSLPYRVAPGIANAPAEHLRDLDDEGGRVAYIVDGDGGGDTLRDDLVEAGIEESRVHSFRLITSEPACLEDLIIADTYIEAVQAELRPYLGNDLPQVSDLAEVGRAATVAAWCRTREVDPPSKIRVAQRVVAAATNDPSVPTPILNARGRAALTRLHEDLATQLGFELPKVEDDQPTETDPSPGEAQPSTAP